MTVRSSEKQDHLYYGILSHEDRMAHLPEGKLGEMVAAEVERDDSDMTCTVFVLAPSATEAKTRISNHFGWEVPVTLVSSGFASVMSGAEVMLSLGVRGTLNWDELEQCPECHGNDLRHDASVGETDCVHCGWGVTWTTGEAS